MKKKGLLMATAVMASMALMACGSGNSSTATTAADAGKTEAAAAEKEESKDAPAADEKKFSLKLAENQSKDNPVSVGVQKFADLVKEKTNGSVEVEVYLDGTLGTENETKHHVQAGTLDFARINTSALSSTVDEVGVFTLPYIFTSTEQKYKVLDGEIGQNIGDALENYNMVSLGYWEAGSRNFYTTKKPITCVADMKGMKIRVQQSDIAIKMVETLGAAATPMSYNEVYQGLQTGVIDGAENDFVSYYTSGHYEVAKYFAMDGHMAPPAMLIMAKNVWDQMSENQQNAIQEAAKEAREWQRQAMQDYQEESRKAVEEKGCEVIDVDVKEFQDAVAPMYDEYPQYKDVIEQIRSIE